MYKYTQTDNQQVIRKLYEIPRAETKIWINSLHKYTL